MLDDVVGSEVDEAILESTAVFLDSKCKIEGFENEFSICDDIDYWSQIHTLITAFYEYHIPLSIVMLAGLLIFKLTKCSTFIAVLKINDNVIPYISLCVNLVCHIQRYSCPKLQK